MKIFKLGMWLVLMLFWGCAKTPVYKSTWQQPSFQLDGNDEDWVGQMYYDSKSGFMYGISNDQDKLYVKLKIADQLIHRKIMVTGLTFWIDTIGKKKKQLGLTFPIKERPNGIVGGGSSGKRNGNIGQGLQNQMDIVKFNSKYKAGMESMLLTNYFGDGKNDFINNKNAEGINAILQYDKDQMLYYEAEIPLSMIFPNPQKFLNDKTKTFSFGFESGKLDMPSMGNQGGGRKGSMGSKGMSPGGRDRQGGGAGRQQKDPEQMEELQAMAEPSIVWIKKAMLEYQSN